MQTLDEIRELLDDAGLSPHRRFGQNFLFDHNLMDKVLDLAELTGHETVLEVGPGTGSLTEELLERSDRVVAVEIDRGLCRLLRRRCGGEAKLTLLCRDVLSGKHSLAPEVVKALGDRAVLVANLPYNIATPLVATCLIDSWRAAVGGEEGVCRFDRLTFTVQEEVAERLTAGAGSKAYGPVSVLVSLLGRAQLGPKIPPDAFWPKPHVYSRIMRIDFDPASARSVADVDVLRRAVAMAFNQRRKQIRSVAKRKNAAFDEDAFTEAVDAAGVDPTARAEEISPESFATLANHLAGRSTEA